MGIYIARRVIISVLLFFMFIVTNISNNVLHISIVSMVEHNTSSLQSSTSKKTSFINFTDPDPNKLHWDAFSIALVQGAYFWGYCITKLPGGLLARRYGSRRVLMISTFIAAVTSCIFPMAAKIHAIFAFLIRVILGLTNGMTWPAAIDLGAQWIPTCERSLFSNIFQGNGLGVVLFYPISGFIIYRYGWESVFYLSGVLCFIWTIFWYYYAYDSPNKHPTISYEEKTYLQSEIKGVANNKNKSLSLIPWKSILTSTAFWASAISMQGSMWCMATLTLQLPRYFTYAHNVNIKTNGIAVGLPNIFKVLSGFIFGYYMDYLVKTQKCSVTIVRKIATITSKIIPAIVLYTLALYTHGDYLLSVILITIFYTFNGTASSASFANLSDIAPNFAGIITGLIQTTIGIPGILSPLIYSSILSSNPYNAWLWVFAILASIETITGVLFLIFGSGKVQNWNEDKENRQQVEKSDEIKKFIEMKP